MSDENCRIAKLEVCVDSIKDNFRVHCEESKQQQKEMMEILQDVRDKQAKMSGFWAGAAFVVSAVATGLTIFFTRAAAN